MALRLLARLAPLKLADNYLNLGLDLGGHPTSTRARLSEQCTVLVDPRGKAYFEVLKNLIRLEGTPLWEKTTKPIPIELSRFQVAKPAFSTPGLCIEPQPHRP
jgi:hypothetical protein